jgi:lathosterol oxidase
LPASTLFASEFGFSKGYCGDKYDIGFTGFLYQTIIILCFTDFVEYCYHWLGHRYNFFWIIHKHHHHFFNPSPFAVIADEWPDQFLRTLPMAILPSLLPINLDLLFAIFATLFYGYGVFLHMGFECSFLSAHNIFLNTSYHHYQHHAKSVLGKPLYTGFFFKIWDNLFNTYSTEQCKCVECRPKRTLKEFNEIEKPDYSILLNINFWLKSSVE